MTGARGHACSTSSTSSAGSAGSESGYGPLGRPRPEEAVARPSRQALRRELDGLEEEISRLKRSYEAECLRRGVRPQEPVSMADWVAGDLARRLSDDLGHLSSPEDWESEASETETDDGPPNAPPAAAPPLATCAPRTVDGLVTPVELAAAQLAVGLALAFAVPLPDCLPCAETWALRCVVLAAIWCWVKGHL